MIPGTFDYRRVGSTEEAVGLLSRLGDEAKLLAGGHSLLPMMKLRLAVPQYLIDLGELADLRYVRRSGDDVAIGALTTHAQVASSDILQSDVPLLAYAAAQVGDPQVRHRGTIGGSLAHADPAADLPMAVLAASATLIVQGPSGQRGIAVDDFFTSPFETAVAEDEMLVEIRVPRGPEIGWGYQKFVRRANDWAIVGVATMAGRVAMANMGGTPLRAGATEQALADGAGIADAAALAAQGTEPGADMHGDAAYRRHLARVLTARALRAASGQPV